MLKMAKTIALLLYFECEKKKNYLHKNFNGFQTDNYTKSTNFTSLRLSSLSTP
jgi:hypothetical protein